MLEHETAIDVFCHLLPPEFARRASELTRGSAHMLERARANTTMCDLQARFQVMERFPGYRQVLSLASPQIEALASPDASPALARLANDELAALVAEHPGRFAGFVAALPLNNPAAAEEEARRAVEQLGAAGVQLFSNVCGQPLDRPETLPLLELCGARHYPIWLHPARGIATPDYPGEEFSRHEAWWLIGWPLETALAMLRITYTGLFDRWPDLTIIAHHAGGLLPMVAGRLDNGGALGGRTPEHLRWTCDTPLREAPPQALRRFYGDTATFGSRAAVACGLDFFGPAHMLFATDMPFGPQQGAQIIADTLQAIAQLRLTASDRQAILSGNALRLLARRHAQAPAVAPSSK